MLLLVVLDHVAIVKNPRPGIDIYVVTHLLVLWLSP